MEHLEDHHWPKETIQINLQGLTSSLSPQIMISSFTPKGHSNNDTEYEVLIAGLELALEIAIDDLMVYHIKKPSLTPYF